MILARRYELYFAIFSIEGLIFFISLVHNTTQYNKTKKQHNKKQIFTTCFAPILSLFICVYLIKSEFRYRFPLDV